MKKSKTSHDSEVPAHGQQVITANALIHHKFDGVLKIFLPKRADTKKFLPSVYELPGGHIDYGEDIVEGLKREVMEEFGVKINVGDPFSVFTYMNNIKGSHSIEVVYFAQLIDKPENIVADPEDHSGYTWVTHEELKNISPMTEAEMRNARKAFELLEGGQLLFH